MKPNEHLNLPHPSLAKRIEPVKMSRPRDFIYFLGDLVNLKETKKLIDITTWRERRREEKNVENWN